MKYFWLIILLFSVLPISAQITLKAGDEAPEITPTEYLLNQLSKTKLKDKFLVLTLCKSWDQPCFSSLPHLDSLRIALPDDKLAFLSVFRDEAEAALKDIEGSNFNISLATDLYGKTQTRYGDGETGLVSWPLTFLIDDHNVVRWQGSCDDLTVEALERFTNGQHPVIDLTRKYVPLAPEDFLFEPMTMEEVAKLWEADSVDSFVRVWDQDFIDEKLYIDIFSADYSFGSHGPATLEDIFQKLFPKKRLNVPGDFMGKKYRVAFVQRSVDRGTADRIAASIFEETGLQATVTPVTATYYTLSIGDQLALDTPRKVTLRNELPEGMKDLGGYSDRDLQNVEIREYSLAELAQLLNKYSPERWRYAGNSRKKYNFILDFSSTKTLLKSLAEQGLKAEGEAGIVEQIRLERIR